MKVAIVVFLRRKPREFSVLIFGLAFVEYMTTKLEKQEHCRIRKEDSSVG